MILQPGFARKLLPGLAGLAMALSCSLPIESRAADPRPNIVFILADDIGYGDFGCYGATKVKTPNVDRLAHEGVRFTDAHATASVCTPTRYSFLTGQYAFRNPAGSHILNGESPLAIDANATTTASLLRQAGYTTGLVGKWHIGLGEGGIDYNQEIKPGPLEVGFDYAFYFPATGDRVPCVFVENHRVVGLDPKDPIQVSYKGKVGDDPTGREHPELLTMKPSYGHSDTIINGISRIGFMAGGKAARWKDAEIGDTLTRKAVAFIEQHQDHPFFLYLATQDIHVPRVPHQRFRGTSGCGVRGDAIQEFDATVGVVLATLERLKLADHTLVIVTSDNGGVIDDGYADGARRDLNGHSVNGPLRGFKGSLWEGGNREPFIARWPGRIKAGSESHELIALVDMLATFAAITGQPLPAGAGPDSFNVLPALLGEQRDKPPRDHLVLQVMGERNLAFRRGPWKLIPAGSGGRAKSAARNAAASGAPAYQLYNLTDDLGETHDVAAQHEPLVKELSAQLDEERKASGSRPGWLP